MLTKLYSPYGNLSRTFLDFQTHLHYTDTIHKYSNKECALAHLYKYHIKGIEIQGDKNMKKRARILLLLMLSCTLTLSGCRRKPIETEMQTESETQSETLSEKETEKETQKTTKTQTEPTEKETQKQTSKVTVSPTQPQTQKQSETQAQTQAQEQSSSQCQYCGGWFYTTPNADGTSDYSNHVAQEEAYIASIGGTTNSGSDSSQYYTDNSGSQYAQCQYCFQWFSTASDANGYSEYSQHVAAEAAYAASMGMTAEYVQCPNCGAWVTPSEYDTHIANGW